MKPSDNEIEMLAAGFAIQHKNGLVRFAHALLDKYAPQASAEDVRNAALEAAAAHIESKKPVGTIALVVQAFADEVRTLKSTPAPTAAEDSEDDMLTIAYLAGAQAEKERAGDALLAELLDDPLLRDLLGYIEDTGPADVWGAAQAWIAKRNAALAAQAGTKKTGGSE